MLSINKITNPAFYLKFMSSFLWSCHYPQNPTKSHPRSCHLLLIPLCKSQIARDFKTGHFHVRAKLFTPALLKRRTLQIWFRTTEIKKSFLTLGRHKCFHSYFNSKHYWFMRISNKTYINLNYVHVDCHWFLRNWPVLILATNTLIPQVQTTVVKATWQENFPFETSPKPTV